MKKGGEKSTQETCDIPNLNLDSFLRKEFGFSVPNSVPVDIKKIITPCKCSKQKSKEQDRFH